MNSRLINVRLDSERLRKARMLRENGVSLSDVVREAIDDKFLRLRPNLKTNVKAFIQSIFERHPDPAGLPPRDYDVHDREAGRGAVLRKIRRAR